MKFDFLKGALKDIFTHPMYKKFQKKIKLMYTRCFGSSLHLNKEYTWVFQYTDTIVGFAALEYNKNAYIIWNVCTDLDEKNVGQQLIAEIVNWAYKKDDLGLFVSLKNPYFHNAFKLYLRNGFTVSKVYDDKIYMKKLKDDERHKRIDDYDYFLLLIKISKLTEFNVLQTFKPKI